jgi:hypothetical protein
MKKGEGCKNVVQYYILYGGKPRMLCHHESNGQFYLKCFGRANKDCPMNQNEKKEG